MINFYNTIYRSIRGKNARANTVENRREKRVRERIEQINSIQRAIPYKKMMLNFLSVSVVYEKREERKNARSIVMFIIVYGVFSCRFCNNRFMIIFSNRVGVHSFVYKLSCILLRFCAYIWWSICNNCRIIVEKTMMKILLIEIHILL